MVSCGFTGYRRKWAMGFGSSKDPVTGMDQRGRAGLQFLGSLQVFSSGELLDEAREDFAAQPEAAALAATFKEDADDEAWRQRLDQARQVAERSVAYRFNRFYQRYVAEENWVRSLIGVERKRDAFAESYGQQPGPNERLILNPDLQIPEYFEGVEWHLEPGGWDGYDLTRAMFAAGIFPYVFSRGGYAAVAVNDDIRAQRREVIGQFRHQPLRRVYDVGCGGAGTVGIVRSMYPDAELVGGDLSARLLTDGHAMSERMGWNITFRQEDGRSVAEPDASFDAVISYALHHEMPQDVSRDALKEMFRILEPGGEMVISDPPPFRAVPPLQGVILDWETDYRAEPYFTEAGLLNLAAAMREIGFVDVEEYALQEEGYPWVTRGRKQE
jgi:SAM-dependent methyltransferase